MQLRPRVADDYWGGQGNVRLPGSSWNFDGDPTGIVMVRR